jgi:hypothetical protein
MRTQYFDRRHNAGIATVLALLLAGCGKSMPTPTVPEPTVAPAPAPAPAPTEAVPAPVATPPAPAAAVLPASPAPAKVVSNEPDLADMKVAQGSSKLSVPVDLRYRFDAPLRPGEAVTLHLAAVPRVAGSNLVVSIKEVPGIRTTVGELRAQKATATTAYRHQVSVTKFAEGSRELRVLVTMDMPVGSAFGWFSVPFEAMPASGKKAVDQQQ